MSTIPNRNFKWIGPHKVGKVLSNENYIFRKQKTNKTQTLQRIRLRIFFSDTPLENNYNDEKFRFVIIVAPQHDL